MIKRNFVVGISLALALSLSVSTLTGCKKEAAKRTTARVLNVKAISITPSDELVWVETLGEAEGAQQVEVRAQVSGLLTKIAYTEGERVKAGQTLFIIDEAPYRAALNAATAATLQARASYTQAQREAQRYQKLFDLRAVSRKALDDAQSNETMALASYNAARAKETDARVTFERTRIKAPSDGIASKCEINLGSLVSASSTLLATLTQPDKLRVKFQVSERDLAGNSITKRNPVRLLLGAGKTISAKIDYVAQQVDVTTSTRSLRAVLDDPRGVYPGELVRVQLAIDMKRNVFRVPQRAVDQKADGTYQVLTIRDNVIYPVTVEVGQWKDTDWVILSGLKGDEIIAVDQLQRLREGMKVNATVVDRASLP